MRLGTGSDDAVIRWPIRRAAVAAVAAIGLSLAPTACNTIAGAGRDIEAAGEAISNQAEETREAL